MSQGFAPVFETLNRWLIVSFIKHCWTHNVTFLNEQLVSSWQRLPSHPVKFKLRWRTWYWTKKENAEKLANNQINKPTHFWFLSFLVWHHWRTLLINVCTGKYMQSKKRKTKTKERRKGYKVHKSGSRETKQWINFFAFFIYHPFNDKWQKKSAPQLKNAIILKYLNEVT